MLAAGARFSLVLAGLKVGCISFSRGPRPTLHGIKARHRFVLLHLGVRSVRPSNPIGGVLLANKTDLRETGRAVVESSEGAAFAESNGLAFFECSAVYRYYASTTLFFNLRFDHCCCSMCGILYLA
jgi:hypothetical protein